MATLESRRILLVKRPSGMPTGDEFRIEKAPVPEPGDGELLIKTLYISVDPYMRGRMRDARSYAAPWGLNEVIVGGIVGEVIESRSSALAAGDFVNGTLGWQDYTVAKPEGLRKLDPRIAPISTAVGTLGMPGMTAYFGLLDIGRPKKGETVVVSGAAGAVGNVAGQLAKMHDCRVVGIAGSERKTSYLMRELGFDAAINYKTSNHLRRAVAEACPNGVDVYFDNVGGEISDAVMANIARHARIPICGQISMYNSERPEFGPRVQPQLLGNSALMQGFLVFEYSSRHAEALRKLEQWVSEKRLKCVETIVEGFENAPKAFLGLFSGENLGKQVVKVAEPSH